MSDPSPPRFHSILLLVAPLGAVALLVGLRAVGEEVTPAARAAIVDPGQLISPPIAVEASVPDAGPAPATPEAAVATNDADDDDDDEEGTFDGRIPNLGSLTPYPDSLDLVASAQPGPDGRLYATRDGKQVPLTLDPQLQQRVEQLLKTYAPPYAAVAALDPSTGRVLALVQYARDGKTRGLGLRAAYPAASIFKIVTASALLEQGVDPSEEVCFHGGKHRIQAKLLEDSSKDQRCYDMSEAMAKSANVVFAKLAHRKLTPERLRTEAARFGFNRDMSFDQPWEKSGANIPDGSFEFATTAAGFGQVFLSPLHGALLAATVGNKGDMPAPTLIDDGSGPRPSHHVITPEVASQISDMMAEAISGGTARRAFHDRGRSALPGIEVAGKTGSLDDKHPFHDYTWFVGFAPKEQPTIALAAVVVNDLVWRIRAPYIARETFKYFLAPQPHAHKAQARR